MDIDRIVMREKRRIVPSWLLVKPKSSEKKLKKHSSELEGIANPECVSSQSPCLDGIDDLVELLRDHNCYHKGCFILHPYDFLRLDIEQREDRQLSARRFRRNYT